MIKMKSFEAVNNNGANIFEGFVWAAPLKKCVNISLRVVGMPLRVYQWIWMWGEVLNKLEIFKILLLWPNFKHFNC